MPFYHRPPADRGPLRPPSPMASCLVGSEMCIRDSSHTC